MGGPGSGRKAKGSSLPVQSLEHEFDFRIPDGKGGYKTVKIKAKDIHAARVKAQALYGQ